MTFEGHNPHLFNWRRFTKRKTPAQKTQLKGDEIDQWMKRVEMASEFAVSEVFSNKKLNSRVNSKVTALRSTDQLQDHDEAYSEAQTLLSDWMNSKLRLELNVDEEEDDDRADSGSVALRTVQPTAVDYSSFDELYNHLAEEEEGCAVDSFLQDLMGRELLDSGTAEEMALDLERGGKKRRDPSVTMETRHKQVRENRARRDADREGKRRAWQAQQEAKEEAKWKELQDEMRRRQEVRRQEEMVQKEMVRLRRQMEEQRTLEQLVRQRERERLERQKKATSPQLCASIPIKEQHKDNKHPPVDQKTQARLHIVNLQCVQRHFSGWFSVVLERRMHLGKAAALCDWRRELRAWQAWRALVWAGRRQRESERTKEELRSENRCSQIAMESDRRRLLRRCLYDWQLRCRMEKEQRQLLAQQEETRRRMATLIGAASSGKLNVPESTARTSIMAPTETIEPQERTERGKDNLGKSDVSKDTQKDVVGPDALVPASSSSSCRGDASVAAAAPLTKLWQVTRRHAAALSAGQLRQAQRRGGGDRGGRGGCSQSPVLPKGSRFEHQHAAQQQTIAQQRELLEEQREEIARLQEGRSLREARRTTTAAAVGASQLNSDPMEQRASGSDHRTADRKAVNRQPVVVAMEERARQRSERRREVEELKRRKEEEMLAQLKAAEEERKREEEEQRQRAAQARKEERRQQLVREQEKQERWRRNMELQTLASQHYHRSLLLRRGLVPWKRLLGLKQHNAELAASRHSTSLLRTCLQAWRCLAGKALSQKQAAADRLHQRLLLHRGLSCWKTLKEGRAVLEERAQHFHGARTRRRVLLALLDHVTQERLLEWDKQERAGQHRNRQVLRGCFLAWCRYPSLRREEREKEARRELLRRKVSEVLPDFRSSPMEDF